MKKLILLPLVALLFSTGCSTKPLTEEQKVAQVQRLTYAAASIGTEAALLANPSYRVGFEVALYDLNTLVEEKAITGTMLRSIVKSLPVKELKSPQATLAIDSATVLFDAINSTQINIESNPYVFAAATGLRDGMKVALSK